ncbi:MAG TPA: DUF4242 domain-containing protein [Egibacteraceae bacterium]|nr:DUF4242 domain-containing protein [Egibacteraceae bacterium]
MPLFMDTHRGVEGLTAEAVADAHAADMRVQDQYGVNYLRYWYNEESGHVYCLVDAPDAESAAKVHREAHGLEAEEIVPVKEGA